MKDLNEMIVESLGVAFNTTEVEAGKGAACATIYTKEPMRNYKYGFLSYSQYNKSIFLVAFNTIEELQDLLDTDDDDYGKLLNMKPQEHKMVRGELFVKLW